MAQTTERLRAIVAELTKMPGGRITAESRMVSDLLFLPARERRLLEIIEREFGVPCDRSYYKVETFGDLAAWLEERLEAPHG